MAAEHIANPELVFGQGRFATADEELSFAAADLSLQTKGNRGIGMHAPVKGLCQRDARLHGNGRDLPGWFFFAL